MYFVITDSKIHYAKNLKSLSRTFQGKLDPDEFHAVGSDFVLKLSNDDLDFIRDKKKLSAILFGNFFRKDKTVMWITLAILFLMLVLFVQVYGIGSAVTELGAAIGELQGSV